MTLQYCSDLHLEFPENKKFIQAHPIARKGDILVLAGDIVPFSIMKEYDDFFDALSREFDLVYWLPGNHEYYAADAAERSGVLHERIRDNVFLVNNISFQHGDVRLLFSTLWSRISPINEWEVERCINDFHQIRFGGGRFSASQFNQLHEEGIRFLRQEVAQGYAGKTVAISHYVPTFLNYPKVYRESILNEAFAVELYDFIEDSGIDCWIYGHHHFNIPDFRIGKASLVTNQLGYVRLREHRSFDPGRVIRVGGKG